MSFLNIRKYLFPIIAITLGTFVSITIIEITLQFFPKILGYDVRLQIDVYLDELKKHKKVSLAVAPMHLKENNDKHLLSFSGISNVRTVNCNESGYWHLLNSDKYGFNNKNEVWDEKVIDYVFLGDSFIYGSCVNNNRTLTSVFKRLSKKNIINLGMPGTGPLTQLATMREYLKKIKVKNVIWSFYEGNDILDFKASYKIPILTKYLYDKNFSQNLINRQNLIDEILNRKKTRYIQKLEANRKIPHWFYFRTRSALAFAYRSIFKKKEIVGGNSDFNNVIKELEMVYKNAREYFITNNIKFYFVFIPDHSRFDPTIKLRQGHNKHVVDKKRLFELVKNLNYRVIDAEETFKKNFKECYAWKDYSSHLSEKGYFVMARLIENFVNNSR